MRKTPAASPEHDVGARLKRLRAKLGLTGEEIARRIEVSRPYWSALENGKRTPGPKLLSALQRVFGVRPDYVALGSGPMFHRLAPKSQQVDVHAATALVAGEPPAPWPGTDGRLALALPGGVEPRYEVIPRMAADALEPAGDFAFSRDWLKRHLGHTSGRLATLQVRGDAMLPTLHDGDTVIVDTGVRWVEASGIYVLALHGDRQVRRIQRMLDDSLVILSDNAAYGKEDLPPPRAKALDVAGRVVWPRLA
jgi:phage repressor protein C with HTH and peptisase S24 domain